MKICHIVYECIPGRFAGGVQKMVLELAVAQGGMGDDVEIWTLGREDSTLTYKGICIRQFVAGRRSTSKGLKQALYSSSWRFDVIHSHNTFLPINRYVAALAKSGKRVYFHAHGALDPLLLSGWTVRAIKKKLYIAAIERRNYMAASGLIGLTSEECSQLGRLCCCAPIYSAPNGIGGSVPAEEEAIQRLRKRLDVSERTPTLFFIGRITHKKGLHILVEALPEIVGNVPDLKVIIFGGRDQDPNYVKMLERVIDRLGVREKIVWGGFLDEEEKRAAYKLGKVFVHPSYSEGMALAILEAMSAGVPTVVTPGCYMREAVEAKDVALADQSPEGLAKVVTDLLLDSQARYALGQRAIGYINTHHSWPTIADRIRQFYLDSGGKLAVRGVGTDVLGCDRLPVEIVPPESIESTKGRATEALSESDTLLGRSGEERHGGANGKSKTMRSEVGSFFDRKAEEWNEKYTETGPLAQRCDPLLRIVKFKKPGRLRALDFGCGTGVIAAQLSRSGHRVDACDISAKMIATGRKTFPELPIEWTVLNAEWKRLPYGDRTFDVIVAASVFEYVEDVIGVLKECQRVLKDKGLLIATVPNSVNSVRRIERVIRPLAVEALAIPGIRRLPRIGAYMEYLRLSSSCFPVAKWIKAAASLGLDILDREGDHVLTQTEYEKTLAILVFERREQGECS